MDKVTREGGPWDNGPVRKALCLDPASWPMIWLSGLSTCLARLKYEFHFQHSKIIQPVLFLPERLTLNFCGYYCFQDAFKTPKEILFIKATWT